MADGFTVQLEGVDELKRALADVSKQIRTKAVRAALREGGKVIQREARSTVPVLKKPTPTRRPGTIKRNIVVRASKFARRDKNEGVYVSVRPLRGARTQKLGKASANNPNDPFYWWFVEFGTKFQKARPFMRRAVDTHGQQAIKKFMQVAVPMIQKYNQRASRVR